MRERKRDNEKEKKQKKKKKKKKKKKRERNADRETCMTIWVPTRLTPTGVFCGFFLVAARRRRAWPGQQRATGFWMS
jgi:hypothetical protein